MSHGLHHRPGGKARYCFGVGRREGIRIEHRGSPARGHDRRDVRRVMHSAQFLVRRRTRVEDAPATSCPVPGDDLHRLGPLGPLGMARWRDVVDESITGDQH
jgi:hypothetical protein